MEVPEKIICVDCGESAHLLTYSPEEGFQIGDYVAYRCSGCNDRWDMIVEDSENPAPELPSFAAEARAILESRQATLKASGKDAE